MVPARVDPANWINFVGDNPGSGVGGSTLSFRQGFLFVVGANRYLVQENQVGPVQVRVYKSVDGVNWVEQDAANRVTTMWAGFSACTLSGDTIWIAYYADVTNIVSLKPFSTVTDTYGAVVSSGSDIGAGYQFNRVSIRVGVFPGGNIGVAYNKVIAFDVDLCFGVYNGAIWTILDQIIRDDVGFLYGPQIATSLMLSTGNFCVFYTDRITAPSGELYMKMVAVDGTMSAESVVYDFGGGNRPNNRVGQPVEHNGRICLPATLTIGVDQRQSLLYGAPLAAPAWTTEVVSTLDPAAAIPFYAHAQAIVDGARLLVVWDTYFVNAVGPEANYIDISYNDGAGWLTIRAYDSLTIGTHPAHNMSAAAVSPGLYGIGFDQTDCVISYYGEEPLPLPPAPAVTQARSGWRRMVILVPNKFDLCLHRELQSHLRNKIKKACCEPILYRNVMWVRAPENFQPFFKTAAIPTPLPADGDVEILAFQIPNGYDGVIAGIFHGYTGPGFREGNGDLEWRLQINRTYAVQLGDVLVSMGSRNRAYLVDGGIQVQSNQWVRYIVNAPNLSGGILPVNSRIFAGVEGLYYARA